MNGFNGPKSYEEFRSFFDRYGGTAELYLRDHYHRFIRTLEEFDATWEGGTRVLDVGAHCLHQAVLWSWRGYALTAVEFPAMFEDERVRLLARDCGIALHGCSNLASAVELRAIPANSVDVVIFTEILEHITFNPIPFWREIHRVLSPGGRVLVTTPNYYSWKGRAWQWVRFLTGHGGGLPIDDVVGLHTYAHHWKEYSLGEVRRYFSRLSPDFVVVKEKRLPTFRHSDTPWKSAIQKIFDIAPILRPNLHVEIAIPVKAHGIVAEARY